MNEESIGTFVVSLDTEFVWGTFNPGSLEPHHYSGTREVVQRLLDRFDRHEIPVTWAVVTHLLNDCRLDGGDHVDTPMQFGVRGDWYESLPCRTGVDELLWYEPNLVDWIQESSVDHDVGTHTHSHLVLEDTTKDAARWEVERSVAVAKNHGIDPSSFVYPRNRLDHRDVLRDAGFEVYRGLDARWFETGDIPGGGRKVCRFAEEATKRNPPTVVPRTESGIVEIPGSQLFRPSHGGWQYTPRHSQRDRGIAGVNKAARTGEIFHLWFHPFNFARDPDALLGELDAVLERAATLRGQGKLDILTMADVATEYRDGRWRDQT